MKYSQSIQDSTDDVAGKKSVFKKNNNIYIYFTSDFIAGKNRALNSFVAYIDITNNVRSAAIRRQAPTVP